MLILSLDTTARGGSAAVLSDDTVLAVVEGDPVRTHGERLPGELEAVLRSAGLALGDIDLLAVARGPGAFTGLRIGLAAMQGLAMVTGRPVVGVSALDALAAAGFAPAGAREARIGSWMDASRGEVFAAAYDAATGADGMPALVGLSEPEVGDPATIWRRWQTLSAAPSMLVGDGAVRYAELLAGATVVAAPALAPMVGRLGRRQLDRSPSTPFALEPLYVRRPDAERGPRA